MAIIGKVKLEGVGKTAQDFRHTSELEIGDTTSSITYKLVPTSEPDVFDVDMVCERVSAD